MHTSEGNGASRRSRTAWTAAFAAAALAVASTTGCATIAQSSPGALKGVKIKGADGEPRELVFIDTSGYYMFWAIPLASGDVRWNDETKTIEGGTSIFSDQVSLGEVQHALLKYAESRNCDLAEVYNSDSDTSYAGASYGGAIGSCFGCSRMNVSAVLVPRRQGQVQNQ